MSGAWHGYYHIGSDCRKIPSSPGIDDNVDDRFGYDPDGGGNRRGFRDVALDGYDRGLGSFRIHLDYLDYCSDGLCRIRRQRRKTKTPQNKKGITK